MGFNAQFMGEKIRTRIVDREGVYCMCVCVDMVLKSRVRV